ncbi:kinase binding protein CGI-121-domain-containing protein, partial [Blyttiomyces helicus]
IHLCLFTNVRNAAELKRKIMSADPSMPASVMINPAPVRNLRFLILDAFQIQLACAKALQMQQQGAMRTRSIYSEILFNLSPSSNINDAIKQFGIADSHQSILVVFVGGNTKENEDRLKAIIEGDPAPLDGLSQLTDVALLNK